jgi:hypothetical protein
MLSLIMWLCAGAVFSTLGGALGAVLFRKGVPPSASTPPTS